MDLVSKGRYFFIFSGALLLVGIASLLWPPALRLGIDFTGGSTLDYTFAQPVSEEAIRDELAAQGFPDAQIQGTGDRSYFIRTRTLQDAQRDGPGTVIVASEKELIDKALEANLAPIEKAEFFSVSPRIAAEAVRNAIIAVVAASVGILLYITYAFRRVPNPFRYGVCALIALVHDALIVVGIFSLLGKLVNLEINAMFITGLLTVIGYSVHDTIVVFDRIRENVARGVGRTLEATINASILETLGRSLNTSLTLVFTLLALILFGGSTILSFLLVLLLGVIAGTYSSIGIASQLLVVWERGSFRKLLRRENPTTPRG